MENQLASWLISLITGGIGGNVAGALLKNFSLGPIVTPSRECWAVGSFSLAYWVAVRLKDCSAISPAPALAALC
jgi:hypothetical protein